MAKPKKEMGLRDFGVKYFDSRRETRGNRNPIRRREMKGELKEKRIEMKAAIKAGEHDRLLNKCGISGKHGKIGESISPAAVRLSVPGGFDDLKVLVHLSLKQGMRLGNGRTILSIKRGEMGANVKQVQMGLDIVPYVHVYRVQ